jgi:hypothetical protein
VGGIVAVRRRARAETGVFEEHVASADRALEAAKAEDKGWDRDVMEKVVEDAVSEARPGWSYHQMHLVLVDDRPGVAEDRAEFVAVGGSDQVRIALARRDGGWVVERVE